MLNRMNVVTKENASYVELYSASDYAGLELQVLGLFPIEVLVGKMAILCRLAIDWLGEVELFDDDARSHIEVRPDDLHQFI